MTSPMTKRFSLIPSTDPNELSPSAASFFPAIPITVGGSHESPVYAPLDVTLPVSTVTSHYLELIGIPQVRSQRVNSPQGLIIIYLPTKLYDEDLQPWLFFDRVPFSVLPLDESHPKDPEVTLGFRGCLSNLRISINFRRKSMSVNSLKRFVLPRSERPSVSLPSSIVQAEQLLELGSHTSAIPLIVSGLEDALLARQYSDSSSSSHDELVLKLSSSGVDESLLDDLDKIFQIRNSVIHDGDGETVSEADARWALAAAKRIIRKIGPSA